MYLEDEEDEIEVSEKNAEGDEDDDEDSIEVIDLEESEIALQNSLRKDVSSALVLKLLRLDLPLSVS